MSLFYSRVYPREQYSKENTKLSFVKIHLVYITGEKTITSRIIIEPVEIYFYDVLFESERKYQYNLGKFDLNSNVKPSEKELDKYVDNFHSIFLQDNPNIQQNYVFDKITSRFTTGNKREYSDYQCEICYEETEKKTKCCNKILCLPCRQDIFNFPICPWCRRDLTNPSTIGVNIGKDAYGDLIFKRAPNPYFVERDTISTGRNLSINLLATYPDQNIDLFKKPSINFY